MTILFVMKCFYIFPLLFLNIVIPCSLCVGLGATRNLGSRQTKNPLHAQRQRSAINDPADSGARTGLNTAAGRNDDSFCNEVFLYFSSLILNIVIPCSLCVGLGATRNLGSRQTKTPRHTQRQRSAINDPADSGARTGLNTATGRNDDSFLM